MLVLTRRVGERIVFPTLGITVELLRVAKNSAQVGIAAPPEIRILREELGGTATEAAARQARHDRANALSKITLAVHLAQKQWAAGRAADAERTLSAALVALEELDKPRKTVIREKPCHALIVEDDLNQRELLASLLVMSGCECTTAADGEDALNFLRTHQLPDIIFLDMAMPRCDGPETLRRIRADKRLAKLPVYSMSSTSPKEVNIPVGPNGFDGWVPKPLNPHTLWELIQTAAQAKVVDN
ncbi:MAG: response regulator [Gemmataceae bacterium]|nr:response regulator [Gemmata sp.]MDW8198873.1 response regulator [Gemmataceae bacterium]